LIDDKRDYRGGAGEASAVASKESGDVGEDGGSKHLSEEVEEIVVYGTFVRVLQDQDVAIFEVHGRT
jgi:hypothetical protein